MTQPTRSHALHDLGYKIFLDRYALKDMTRETLAVGDTVVALVDPDTRQREIGTVEAIDLPQVTITLRDGTEVTCSIEEVDKPLETDPGQMMDRVARGVAAVEATEGTRVQWAERFRWLLDDWKFVPGGRILAAAGTDQQLTYYNCMPPDQEILTVDGYKPIGDVRIGELVVTHRNRLRPIRHRLERETNEPLYIINPRKIGYDSLRVTGEHKVYVIRSEWVNSHRSRDGVHLKHEPDWIPAKDLKHGDFVAVAYDGEECTGPATLYVGEYLPKYEVENGQLFKSTARGEHGYVSAWGTHYSLNNELVVDAELCSLFGRWLGDGCVTHRTGTDIPSGIKIVFNLDELRDAVEIARIFEDKFGIVPSIKLSSTERWYDLWVNSMPVGEFFKSFLGVYSHSKRIPSVLMHLPDELTIALLRGLFRADGYISGNALGMLLSNRELMMQVHQLLLRLGYFFSIKENTHKNGRVPAYRVQATSNECGPLFKQFFDIEAPPYEVDLKYYLEYGGLRWVRIDSIEVEDYSGVVMDIEVEEDHSFVSAGVVVSNCYVVPMPHDSRDGIIETLRQMTEIMSRGGGVGINISSLRPRYAYVRGVNGRSSGTVSWGELYSFVTGLIEQGGSRRGALMVILNDWHPDIYEFVNVKRNMDRMTNANISVGVSDRLMEAVENDGDWDLVFPDTDEPGYDDLWDGDLDTWIAAGHKVVHYDTVRARDVWNAIIESAWASAEPGIWFRERTNKFSNSYYFSPLICTNPCITGDTLLYTDQGLRRAQELFDDETEVEVVIDGRFGLDSATTPATRVFRTGTRPVYRLQTQEGYFVRATADHRFMTPRGWIELQDLEPGDTVHILNRKGGFGSEGTLELGRVLGWLVGDGTIKADKAVLSFFGDEKRELAPLFAGYVDELVEPLTLKNRAYPVGVVEVESRDEARIGSARLRTLAQGYDLTEESKHHVPEAIFTGSEDMQRGFLQALFTADGSFQDGGAKGGSIRLAASHIALIEGVQQILLNFGIASRIYRERRKAGYRELPDSNRELKPYWCEAQHELVITKQNMMVFADEIGFLMDYKQAALEDYITRGKRGPYRETFAARVESITEDGIEDVFDVTEPLTHSLVVNGLVAHNCGEQPLSAWSVCNLGAINLAKFHDAETGDVAWDDLRTAARCATRFLDNVIDTTPYFFEENRQQQLNERRVGLGTMGLAELMIRLGIRYGSDESLAFIDKLYEFLATTIYEMSTEIAQEKESFPEYDAELFLQSGYMQQMPERIRDLVRERGIRNVTLMTQAPTGTTGTLVNTSTGIEPFFSWSYFRKSRLGMHEEQVPLVREWYAAHPETAELPDYFVTAMDLTPLEHVRVQAAIQRWVDSAISKTSNVPNEYTVEQTRELYESMYRLGCKGGTIYRDGSRNEQVLMLKAEEKADMETTTANNGRSALAGMQDIPQVASPNRVDPRPKLLTGVTVSVKTPFGTGYITMNTDEEGNPFEVFVTIGKAGSDLQADAEGLGRMISLLLRTTAPQNRLEMLKLIIDQLRNIGGVRSVGLGNGRVSSLPDAVASTLEQCYLQRGGEQLQLPGLADGPQPVSHSGENALAGAPGTPHGSTQRSTRAKRPSGMDMCPACGTISLVRAEGCQKCLACGYSEC